MIFNPQIKISEHNPGEIKTLKAGTWINFSGILTTMRDSTHMELMKRIDKGEPLPVSLENRIILYAAPVSGEKTIIGPTTSIRMDQYLEFLFRRGVIATIGKGKRSPEAVKLIREYKSPYFILLSGVSAFLSGFFSKEKIIAFPELGPEAMREYRVENLPLMTGIDSEGTTI
ncbi:MAG: fumarate hydratase C-terminal domain-containing protein [Oligoflexia bacterium]|nr:fumarate hydratase C-terminal domain-containing protein [Oligoflexia bacterium]